nr:hypothetical protein [Tanacetum cinerariifolium]
MTVGTFVHFIVDQIAAYSSVRKAVRQSAVTVPEIDLNRRLWRIGATGNHGNNEREMKSLMREKGDCLRKACLKVPTERTTLLPAHRALRIGILPSRSMCCWKNGQQQRAASQQKRACPSNQPPQGVPYPYHLEQVIGGDSVLSIERRLLSGQTTPSPLDIYLARIDAKDLFEAKVKILQRMVELDL